MEPAKCLLGQKASYAKVHKRGRKEPQGHAYEGRGGAGPLKGPKSFINTIGFLVGKQRAAQKHLGFARCAAATDMIKQIPALPKLLEANGATSA